MSTVWHSVAQLSELDGQLAIDGCKATDLVKEFGSPLYVYSENRIRENYRRLLNAYRKRYPKFEIYYAVKANNNPAIVQILSNEGSGADCSCLGELQIAKDVGVPADKRLFTGVFPSRKDFIEVLSNGAVLNVDNIDDLDHIIQWGSPDILSFRINPDHGASGEEGLVFAGPDAKFGVSQSRVEEAYTRAKELGVKRFGVHMMAGSNVLEPKFFGEVVEKLFDIIGPIAQKLNIRFEFVDIGGSLGVPYYPDQSELDIEAVAESVTNSFKLKLKEYHLGEPILIQEPGRYLVADAGVLLTSVNSIKKGECPFVGVDAGMNTLLRPALYKTYHHILYANNLNAPCSRKYHVVGPICENTDQFASDRSLPGEISEEDILAILNVGAYGFCMSSQYNTQPRAAELLVWDGKAEVIRKREDMKDINRNVVIPERLRGARLELW